MDEDEFRCGATKFRQEAARHGIGARLYWPGLGEVTTEELVLAELLPMAHEGLDGGGLPPRSATGSSA